MKIGVLGLWHLGTVTAACLADAGFEVLGVDEEPIVAELNGGRIPIQEPGLSELVAAGSASGKLRFSSDLHSFSACEVVIVSFDTPVDENDVADVDFVYRRVVEAAKSVSDGTVIVMSSQVPVGFGRKIGRACADLMPTKTVHFACSPENLRLGRALECFTRPDRIVIGTESAIAREKLASIYSKFTPSLIWMSTASAEMTKHAINSYLGMAISFANEIATICEVVGADAREVEIGLKSEPRIGERAPLSPGGAFAGGTLARDISYLVEAGREHDCPTFLLSSIAISNEEHKRWALQRLLRENSDLTGRSVAVLGLTYKPGTDTLRRSSSIELCQALKQAGADVRMHDPSITSLPDYLSDEFELSESAQSALRGAQAMILSTPWPEYKNLLPDEVLSLMAEPVVLDANGFLRNSLGANASIRYFLVGKA